MFVRSKTDDTQAQHGIFGDEEAAELRATLSALTEQVDELQAQMRSQITATATHASIAQEQADFVKREARSELEQTRSTLIGLIEQVRAEVRTDTGSVDPLPAPSGAQRPLAAQPGAAGRDHEKIVNRLDIVEQAVSHCFARQQELVDTMSAVLDTVTAAQHDAPVRGLSLA